MVQHSAAKMKAVLLILLAISLSRAVPHDGICRKGDKKPASANKPFPPIPDVFSMDIQMNIHANKTTRHLFEIFDSPNGRAIVGESESTGPYHNISLTGYDIYNFNTNQIVELFQLPDSTFYCNASTLDGKGADTFMFGETVSSKTGFTAKSAFRVDTTYPPTYQGKETLSTGAMVEKWADCVYIAVMDATVNVMWYFTDVDSWTSPLGVQVPMLLTVKGMTYHPNTQGRVIDHSYTFTGFSDYIPAVAKHYFQVPPGTVCPFLKDFDVGKPTEHVIPIPQTGTFSFNAEFIQKTDTGAGLVTDIREFYDSQMSMSRYDYVPKGMLAGFLYNSDFVNDEVSEIHDFLTGLAYIKDKVRGNCTVKPLFQSQTFDVQGTDGNHVRMKTVAEFFGLTGTKGSSMDWTYTGQRVIRDIPTDVYVAERLGFPPNQGDKIRSVWEIAFTSSNYFDVSKNAEIQVSVPMRIWIKVPDLDYEMSYNIYNFDDQHPDTWRFDVGSCYPDDKKTNVMFKIPGDQRQKLETNTKVFKYFLLVNIIGYLDILPSRISNVEWYADDNDSAITVQFQMLDPPSIPGSTGNDLSAKNMMPTSAAIDILTAAINNGSFIVEIGSIDDLTPVVAFRDSVTVEIPPVVVITKYNVSVVTNTSVVETIKIEDVTTIKLNAGAAAGIAIAFFVVGFGIGFLVIFLINKFKPGTTPPNLTMSFTNKNFDS